MDPRHGTLRLFKIFTPCKLICQ